MTAVAAIEDIGGLRVRFSKRGGWWRASVWCSCEVGDAHWHDVDERARSRAELVALLLRRQRAAS